MKIRKAEQHEKLNYENAVHPLFGFVKVSGVLNGVKSSWQCPVEYLGEGKDEPNYEVLAPKGMYFADDGRHTILGTTQRDLLDQITTLEPCGEDCK